MRTIGIVVGVAMASAFGIAAFQVGRDAISGSTLAVPGVGGWPGALHLRPGANVLAMQADPEDRFTRADPTDTAPGWVDIVRVDTSTSDQPHWRIEVAVKPPGAARRSSAGQSLSYGLVFDITEDGVADILVGIDDDAPIPGEFRVWVTDLATNETHEQLGAPYGFPVEFRHPDEQDVPGPPTMVFTFLGGSRPIGLTAGSRFYAWSALRDPSGAVLAWDHAPDDAWLTTP